MPNELALSMAVSEYDHVRDITSGAVAVDGIRLTSLSMQTEEIFFRALNYNEFEVCELSLGKYASLISQGDDTFSAIPVFPSRQFRHSSAYVLRDGPVKSVEDLRGRKVGVPEWAQTAAVYSRGFLTHDYGIPLAEIQWVQAGTNQAGRTEKVALRLPPGVSLVPVPDKSLNELLLSGEIAALFAGNPPTAFKQKNSPVVQLFPDYQRVEEAYFLKTGIYPIMHVVAIKRDILTQHPWVARNLYTAFDEAKRRSLLRAAESTASRFPVPWSVHYFERAQTIFGPDPFAYGIEANQTTLDAFVRFAHEQGVTHRLIGVHELFWPTTAASFRV
jgi:4,5-dihydroxyphthalate decarboxylase